MSLTERDMELVNLAAREAAFTAIRESDTTLRMMARDEARPIAKAAAVQESRISTLRIIILALLAGGGGGAATQIPELFRIVLAFSG